MNKDSKGVMILTPFFSPNIGGVETHLDDLVSGLDDKGYNVFVQTYSPITTPGISWEKWEKKGNGIFITRYGWFGKDLFHKLENYPLLDFLYLTPYLLIRVLIFMFLNGKKIQIIHAQGLNAAFIGVVLKKLFRKKLLVSPHAVYGFQKEQITGRIVKSVLQKADRVLGLSKIILDQFPALGVDVDRMAEYKYWVNVDSFKPLDQQTAREKTGIDDKFTVLFVGRLIKKKGIDLLIEVAKELENVQFVFIGGGPEDYILESASKSQLNIRFLGKVENSELHNYYNSSDIYCIPSIYEEGFGRVGMEAVACGIPVVGSSRGGIGEALDKTVSILVEPTVKNLKEVILDLYNNRGKLHDLKKNCRDYALKNFSKENIELILKHY